MPFKIGSNRSTSVLSALAGLVLLAAFSFTLAAQSSTPQQAPARQQAFTLPAAEPSDNPTLLAEDRGKADLVQTLRRLGTTASVLMITAHPDDEDGGLLTYLSRGTGARVVVLTLNRGEGGQNAMSGDLDDALGLIRTNELLNSDEYYGTSQLWGTEVDFGFSKTQEESFKKWTHDRVLYDAVLAVRKVRPQVIVSTFVGGITDGHGQHQVSGEIAQEAFKAAADPKVFPEQLKDGLEPWQALALYSDIPFAPIQNGQMFDYATGKWAAAGFRNYLTGEWTTGALSADVTVAVGGTDPVLGESYSQLARTGKSKQKSQFGENFPGGGGPPGGGPASSSYHLWAVAPAAMPSGAQQAATDSLFRNPKVSIETSVEGLAKLAGATPPAWLTSGLSEIQKGISQFSLGSGDSEGEATARKLVPVYRRTLELEAQVRASSLTTEAKADLTFELDTKIQQFQRIFADLLGLELTAFRGKAGGGLTEESSASVAPGEELRVRVHTAKAFSDVQLSRVWLESASGSDWKAEKTDSDGGQSTAGSLSVDRNFKVTVPADAEPTQPYFSRPSIEQAYYDLSHPEWRERSFAPWPLAWWAEFTFDGVPIRVGEVVQTVQRATAGGEVYTPLVVTPAIGVSVEPQEQILPLDGSALPVRVTVHAQAAAEGSVSLELPEGWRSEPAKIAFHLAPSGNTEPLVFSVTPAAAHADGVYRITAVARSGGKNYRTGWRSVGYTGLRPYNLYTTSVLQTRKVGVNLASGLRVAYIMGSGDEVPSAIEALGVTPHLLSASEIASADLSAWNVIVIGIRAYSTRSELTAAQARLNAFVESGGTLIVQYQSSNFPAPLSLELGRSGERVVEETAGVKLLAPEDPLFSQPNRVTTADFDGWVEERGHGFPNKWDPGYTALTETADAGQDAQRGGLLVTHPGKGTYIYVAYALYRQFPELVPGAYRLFANLLSAGR
jgi:LmbE family N-acetylglucosaminyl deacetylase